MTVDKKTRKGGRLRKKFDPRKVVWLKRKTKRKNSSLWWGGNASGFVLEKLKQHMAGFGDYLHALFGQYRWALPRNSELLYRDVRGFWLHCPNALADDIEALIAWRHAEFISRGYDEAELSRDAAMKSARTEGAK